VKRLVGLLSSCALIAVAIVGLTRWSVVASGQGRGGRGNQLPMPSQDVPIVNDVPQIPFDVDDAFFKVGPDMNFGEVLGVAVNSKGNIVVLNHPGTATSGPVYGNATTQLWEFDQTGKFLREIGKGVYGMVYGHGIRFDKYDNLWYVDKAANSIIKFNPAGMVLMNLGRRGEGYDTYDYHRTPASEKVAGEGTYDGPTDVAWDAADNIYISDGYVNSRIAKLDKNGDFIKSWGSYGNGDKQFRNPHNMQIDKQGNIYVGDRGNGRIHVYDTEGNFKKYIWLNAAYDKKHHPTLAAVGANPPNAAAPWALCITTTGPTQYLYAVSSEPGTLYKLTLDGKILGQLGTSGRTSKQFNWPHGLACPSENTVFVADMNNWRPKKLTLHPAR
jgi:6-bladed beta-propeller